MIGLTSVNRSEIRVEGLDQDLKMTTEERQPGVREIMDNIKMYLMWL